MSRVVLDPTGERSPSTRQRVERPASLEGRTIGLLDISKARGDKFLDEMDRNRGITTVTRWIVFCYMPIIPIGSYRVKRSVKDEKHPEIIGKVNLQWDQVFRGWRTTALILLAFVCALLMVLWWGISHNR